MDLNGLLYENNVIWVVDCEHVLLSHRFSVCMHVYVRVFSNETRWGA